MSANCGHHLDHQPDATGDAAFRRVLWLALIVNAAMFVVELASAQAAGSTALLADSVDFLGDAVNYGLSLFVLSMTLLARSRVAMLKGATMVAFGLWVVGQAVWNAVSGTVPEPVTMGVVGLLALAANVGVAVALYAHRNGDSNRRSVWLCTRNDAIGNLAVLLAAVGVFGTGTGWPDFAVATIMAALALHSGWQVVRLSRREMQATAQGAMPAE